MDYAALAGQVLGGSDASPAAPQTLYTNTGAINVGGIGHIDPRMFQEGNPNMGGYGVDFGRFGNLFSDSGNTHYSAATGAPTVGMNTILIAGGLGLAALLLLKRGR